MNKYQISMFVIISFSIFGLWSFVIVTHELYHKWDVRDVIIKGTDKIVLFGDIDENASWLMQPTAHYEASYDTNKTAELKKIEEHAELRAYSLSAVETILFMVFFWLFLTDLDKARMFQAIFNSY